MAKSKSPPLRAVVRFSEDSHPVPQWVYRELCLIFYEAAIDWATKHLDAAMAKEAAEQKRLRINELHRKEYAKRKAFKGRSKTEV